jgi:hypothetical protein
MLRRTLSTAFTALFLLGAAASPSWAAGGGGDGTGGGAAPPPPPPPPAGENDDGHYGGSTPGSGGYDDGDESSVIGCGAYTPVSSAAVEAIYPSSTTDGSYGPTAPYIEADDWSGYQDNPSGTWFVCYTTTPPRGWYDYVATAIPAIDFGDYITPPEVVFRPDASHAVIDVETWVALAANSGEPGYQNVRIDENVAFYDWEVRPRRIIWTPGDGSEQRSCEIPDDPRPAPEEIPSESDEGCSYVYRRPSVGEPESAFRVRVQVEYEAYIRVAPAGAWELAPGDNPVLGQPVDVPVRVGELQAVAD